MVAVFIWQPYNVDPEALIMPMLVCSVCGQQRSPSGKTTSRGDLIVVVIKDLERMAQTIPLGVHKGTCDAQLERVVRLMGLAQGWEDAEPFLAQLAHNFAEPIAIGEDRILGPSPMAIDLSLTTDVLDQVRSPLLQRPPGL